MGWNIDMGAIQRSTKYGVNYGTSGPNTNMFVEIVNGHQSELVSLGSNYYGTKIEGSLSKYYFNSTSGGWEVTTKDGTKYYYGTNLDSRQAFGTNNANVFKWCLDKVQDVHGNYMTITYTKEQGEIYMSRIDYVGNSSNGLSLPTTNYINFILETRSDVLTNALSPFTVNTAKRLKMIEVYGNGVFQRKYVLNYEYSGTSCRSRLISVNQYGNDMTSILPPTLFQWQSGCCTGRCWWH
jgi:hypothetical protein